MTATITTMTTGMITGTVGAFVEPASSSGDPGWRDRAACRTVDPDLFFPIGNTTGPERRQIAAAKRICAACPVRVACVSDALEAGDDGIRGGYTADERRALHLWARSRLDGQAVASRGSTTSPSTTPLVSARSLHDADRVQVQRLIAAACAGVAPASITATATATEKALAAAWLIDVHCWSVPFAAERLRAGGPSLTRWLAELAAVHTTRTRVVQNTVALATCVPVDACTGALAVTEALIGRDELTARLAGTTDRTSRAWKTTRDTLARYRSGRRTPSQTMTARIRAATTAAWRDRVHAVRDTRATTAARREVVGAA